MAEQDVTERVLKVVAETQRIPLEKVTVDSALKDLGIDSMDGVNILFALENEFNITIPDEQANKIRSIRDMVEGVASLVAASGSVSGSKGGD